MVVSEIIRNRLGLSPQQTLLLRDGQIIKGKINRLFPANKAEIQVGSHTMIAEITTPLRVGDRYIFQVHEKADQLIHLRVMSESIHRENNHRFAQLLRLFGIKESHGAVHFIRQLFNDKVLFDQTQIKQAMVLLDRVGYGQNEMNMVKEMISHRLPLTETIYRALSSVKMNQLSPLLNEMLHEMKQNPAKTKHEQQIILLLERLTNRTSSNDVFPPLLTKKFEPLLKLLNMSIQTPREIVRTLAVKPFQPVEESIATLVKNESQIKSLANKVLHSFPMLETSSLSDAQMQRLNTIVKEQLLPLLPVPTHNQVQSVIKKGNQAQLFDLLHLIVQKETYQYAKEILNSGKNEVSFSRLPLQTQFLTHLYQTIHTLGLSDEQMIATLSHS